MSNIQLLPSVPNPGYYNSCSGALSIIMPQESVNLIAQPSFEMYESAVHTAPTTWQIVTSTGATVNPVSSYIAIGEKAWSGAASLYSRTIAGVIVRNIFYKSINTTANKFYSWSFYVYGATGSHKRRYQTTIRDTSTNTLYASKTFELRESQWQRIDLVWRNISATSIYVGIEKELFNGSYSGGDCYIDACQFEQLVEYDMTNSLDGLGATTYFDGSITGFYNDTSVLPEYSWRGNLHQSASYRSQQTTHGGRIVNLQDELDLTIISVNEANINQPQNQEVIFNTNDGGVLLDIVNPKRTITFIGRISGTDKSDFAQKVSRLSQYFSRDVSSIRLPKRFIFQHKDGYEDVGNPITFYGAFQSGLNITLSDVYTANVEISITMYNPYFYGHDEGVNLGFQNILYNPLTGLDGYVFTLPSTLDESYTSAGSLFWKQLTALANVSLNNIVNTMAFDGVQYVWMGGNFTADTNGNTYNRIVRYDLFTKTFVAVLTGVVNGVSGGNVEVIKIAPNGDVWVGGSFTSAGGVANTGYVAIYRGNAFIATPAQPNNTVFTIEIDSTRPASVTPPAYPFRVWIGGDFTLIGGVAFNRIAYTSPTAYSWLVVGTGAGGGVNGSVRDIRSRPNEFRTYFCGSFTTSTAGATLNRIGFASSTTPATAISNIGWGLSTPGSSIINNMTEDSDGTLIFGATVNTSTDTITSIPAGTTISVTSGAMYFLNNQLRCFGDSNMFGKVTLIRNGLAFQSPPTGYWNGSAVSGTTYVPFGQDFVRASGSGISYGLLELPDGTIFIGIDINSSAITSRVERVYNSSTVSTKPILYGLLGQSGTLRSLWNLRNQKYMQISIFFDNRGSAPRYDYFYFDFEQVTATSGILGNLLRYMLPSSYLFDFTIEPGLNYLSVLDYTQSSGNVLLAGSNRYALYWTQTYQSIFDGINND